MQSKELEDYIEFLLSAALQRCGNIYDAEDLTQETLLAALSYMARGKDIQDVKAWLLVVMGRKFNDMLRKRYKQPIVSIGDDFDIVDENAIIQLNDEDDEAENVRKAVAYLAKSYREVIVQYYMNGQSVSQIASELGIPEGTVKKQIASWQGSCKERNQRYGKILKAKLFTYNTSCFLQWKSRIERRADHTYQKRSYCPEYPVAGLL